MAARREILIDAYNVMFAHPQIGPLVRRDLAAAREEFLRLCVQRLPADGSLGVVVFDATRDPRPPIEMGSTGPRRERGLQVVYARDSADAWIENRVRTHPTPALLTVVTSDREILDVVRAHGANVLRVSEFLQLAQRRQARMRAIREVEKPEQASRREIEEMRKLFEDRKDED